VTGPLVSVVTPTWGRHAELTGRAIPSVQAQTYEHVEHVVVSDGPDPQLRELLDGQDVPGLRFLELSEHDPAARWGHWARLAGIEAAKGDLIAYLDDDNAYRENHLAVLVDVLVTTGADFAYSRMQVRGSWGDPRYVVGAKPPQYGQIDTSLIVHRRELLTVGTWEQSLPSIDWDLADRWVRGGARWAFSPETTADYYLGQGR
jgi:glycosyltransferase involved in cell wall biosynthesis